jgi:hypothetical protein
MQAFSTGRRSPSLDEFFFERLASRASDHDCEFWIFPNSAYLESSSSNDLPSFSLLAKPEAKKVYVTLRS